jgi:hypothetical protein
MHLAYVTSFFSFFQRRTSENGINKQPKMNVTNGLFLLLLLFWDSVSARTVGSKGFVLKVTVF